jgi:hypothetical protein
MSQNFTEDDGFEISLYDKELEQSFRNKSPISSLGDYFESGETKYCVNEQYKNDSHPFRAVVSSY